MLKSFCFLLCLLLLVFTSGCSKRYAFRKTISVDAFQSMSKVKMQTTPEGMYLHQTDSVQQNQEIAGQESGILKKGTPQKLTFNTPKIKANRDVVLKRAEEKKEGQKSQEDEMNNIDKSVFSLTMMLLAFLLLMALPFTLISFILLIAVFVLLGMTIYYALMVFFDKQKGKGWAVMMILLGLLMSFVGFAITMLSWARADAGGP